ncbi:mannoprotein [Rhizoctonia solani AG-3 Rhs1AP]|uniref:Mannoprotein n=1 Tax=Rhizoctonia solani AG-3 Rhs1AP TaxID=1086054 RepID=A0A0A1UHV6_9AGAM|nr:mannoprotein [Rhizoctonia solani AG-3 Rhs1AP]
MRAEPVFPFFPLSSLAMCSKFTLFVGASLAATTAFAQNAFTPLAEKRFEYNALPYKADTDNGERGTQFGYNICNSTTEGQTSLCQTSMINSIDDFCLWGPPEPNSLIGDTEGEAVAWCTKPGRGTRVIPAGALTGVQFMKTRSYVQVVGRIKQEYINIAPGDSGGEMDPHGADLRGNPLGGLVFSNAFPSNGGRNDTFQQVIEWHNFMGANLFCLKACDPTDPDDDRYCEHIFDRIGCWYNAPAAYVDGVFESCEGENQDFPGVYTDSAGQVQTYSQPPESLGAIATMPFQPRIPASSNCVAFQSAALYTSAPPPPALAVSSTSSAAPTSAPPTPQGAGGNRAGSSTTGTPTPSRTPAPNAAASVNGATGLSSFNLYTLGSVALSAFIGALAVL